MTVIVGLVCKDGLVIAADTQESDEEDGMKRLDVKKIIAEGNDAAVFFELETKAPAAATTLVAEWHQIKNGKISHVESAFDGRPFAAMFAGGKRT